jgi:hypothetical protein
MQNSKVTVEWRWFNKDKYGEKNSRGWTSLSEKDSATLEQEYQCSQNGTRTKRNVYNCFGGDKQNAYVSFGKMETMCAGICCGLFGGGNLPKGHMIYKIKRVKLVSTDIDFARILKKNVKKHEEKKIPVKHLAPVWYWLNETTRKAEGKWIKVPGDVNKEIEKEFQDDSRQKRDGMRGYHCFGDKRALAYVNFNAMQTCCRAVTCIGCDIGRCKLQMAFKVKRRME